MEVKKRTKRRCCGGSHADAATIDDNAVNRSAVSEFGIVICGPKGQWERVWLVRGKATDSGSPCAVERIVAQAEDVVSTSRPTHGSRTVFHLARLSKGKGSGTVELGTRLELELVQATLARLFMLLGIHTKVVLGIATGRVSMEEGAVATVEDIDFRKGEVRILVSVFFAVLRADELGPVVVRTWTRRTKDC